MCSKIGKKAILRKRQNLKKRIFNIFYFFAVGNYDLYERYKI
jgi:hypothetical protein